MGKIFTKIEDNLKSFIADQKIFFVGTAGAEGSVNISPKGMDTLRVLDFNTVVWLNLTGSGNETAAHILKNKRMTLMFCAFEGKPMILRLYGNASVYHERDTKYHAHIGLFPKIAGARQIIELKVERVQTSCGYAVPFMEFKEERRVLETWAEKKGEQRLKEKRKK